MSFSGGCALLCFVHQSRALVLGSSVLVDRLYRAVLQGRRCLVGKRVVTPWALGSSAQESDQADLGLLGSKARRGDGFHLWICALFQCNMPVFNAFACFMQK